MGKYPLSPSEKARFDRIWGEMAMAKKAEAVVDFDHFCQWLRGEDYSFYNAIKEKLYELWESVKETAGDIAEGFAKGFAAVAVTPIVGIAEGIEKTFEDGPIEGVKHGFKKMGEFLDDLFD